MTRRAESLAPDAREAQASASPPARDDARELPVPGVRVPVAAAPEAAPQAKRTTKRKRRPPFVF